MPEWWVKVRAALMPRQKHWWHTTLQTVATGLTTTPIPVGTRSLVLSLNWFSGRLVPGVDPADEENADEQMNFGFVSGDAEIRDAYFYATAYPPPMGWTDSPLPAEAYWHSEGWTGAVLMYERLAGIAEPEQALLDFLTASWRAGAEHMK